MLIRSIPNTGSKFVLAAQRLEMAIDDGAGEDLAIGSFALSLINRTNIPGHAFVGIGGSYPEPCDVGWAGPLFRTMGFFDPVVVPIGGRHDCVVGEESQLGGLSWPAASFFEALDGGLHTHNTTSGKYSERATELVHKSASDPEFAEFPPPRDVFTVAPTFMPQMSASLLPNAPLDPAPVIVTPAPNTEVIPGKPVHVVVEATNSTRVLIVGPETSAVDDSAPFEFDLVIPVGAVGSFPIQAFAAYDTGAFAESNTVTLNAQTSASLRSLSIVPREMILVGPGTTRSLVVLGTYSDGVTRDITDASTGTTYIALSPGIASVSPAGVVTGGSPGAATVLARNGVVVVHQVSVNITVLP